MAQLPVQAFHLKSWRDLHGHLRASRIVCGQISWCCEQPIKHLSAVLVFVLDACP